MKILLSSYVFAPSVGGIETVSALLAPEFVKAGHEVVVVTDTGREDGIPRNFTIYRKPSISRMIELTRWCDVYFQSNISLRFAWPLVLVQRPWIIAHQTWLNRSDRWFDWQAFLKLSSLRFSTNVAISDALAQSLPVPATIVGNPYNDTIFRRIENVPRDHDIVYLGRLVSEKGIDVLIRSLAELRQRGHTFRLSIIGAGPELPVLRRLVTKLNLDGQVDFLGLKSGEELARLLNTHRVLVVPSRLPEPFGVVALEGLACGCVVIASQAGGLPNVVGPYGVTFEKDNPSALASALEMVLTQPGLCDSLLKDSERHLDQYKPATIAAKYLKVFADVALTNPRRLLIYSTLPLVGGNSTITLNVARQFRQQGWDVSVLTRHQHVHGLSEENIKCLEEMGCEVRKLTLDNGRYGWRTLSALIWIFRNGGDQVFITLCKGMVSPMVSLLGRFKRSIFYLITHEKEEGLRQLATAKYFYTELAVISPITSAPLKRMVGPEKPVCWLPQFSDFDTEKSLSFTTGRKRNLSFGFLGTLSKGKGVDLLLQLWPTLDGRADLRLAGSGPLQKLVETASRSSQNEGPIFYDGSFNASERDEFLERFFQSIDYLIVPSVNTMEGIPTVILEALSRGVPALASNLGGTACFGLDWLRPQHPGVVELFSLSQMKEKVESAIEKGFPDEDQRKACVTYYQEWFSNKTILKRWADVVEPSPTAATSGIS